MKLDRKYKRPMTKHESGFKAAESSYHVDTNPISQRATPDPSVSNPCKPWESSSQIWKKKNNNISFMGELYWNNMWQNHWEPTGNVTKSAHSSTQTQKHSGTLPDRQPECQNSHNPVTPAFCFSRKSIKPCVWPTVGKQAVLTKAT